MKLGAVQFKKDRSNKFGVTTLSITTFSIATLSIITLSTMTLSKKVNKM
jgi:hypothetical protein